MMRLLFVVVSVASLVVGTVGGGSPKLLEALRHSSSSSPHVVDGSISHVESITSPPPLPIDAAGDFTMSIVYAANDTTSLDWLDSIFPKMVTGVCSTMIKWDIIPAGDVTIDVKGGVVCKDGEQNCEVMKHHACLVDMRQHSDEALWLNKNIQCLSHFKEDEVTDDIWEFCLGQDRYHHVQQCVKRGDGDTLLKKFVKKAKKLNINKSDELPAVAINGKKLENNESAMSDGVCQAASKRRVCCHNWPNYDYDLLI